jgi:hypothetical protein
MATKDEHPEKHGWWINEESLGVTTKRTNELNYLNDLRSYTFMLHVAWHKRRS